MRRDLTAWLSAGTLALSAWILFEVHSLRVDLEVLRTEQVDLARRVDRIEEHYGR
jgi:hypothetical protein